MYLGILLMDDETMSPLILLLQELQKKIAVDILIRRNNLMCVMASATISLTMQTNKNERNLFSNYASIFFCKSTSQVTVCREWDSQKYSTLWLYKAQIIIDYTIKQRFFFQETTCKSLQRCWVSPAELISYDKGFV